MPEELRHIMTALDDVIAAFKQRVAELEATVRNQQVIIEAHKAQEASGDNDPSTRASA